MTAYPTVYGMGQGTIQVSPKPLVFTNDPTSSQTNFAQGQIVFSKASSNWFIYSGAGVWDLFSSNSGSIVAVNGTANQITASTVSGTTTLSVPATFIAPGSIASTSTLTGGTGVTATTGNISATAGAVNAGTSMTATSGNITATNGNFVSSAAGKGLVLTPTVVGPAATPQTANGRAFAVTFSSVSIASGASQTFVINNSAITGAGTQVLLGWAGATAGSALSISSQASTAGVLTIIMTNGTSATMVTSTANITFTGLVLN